MSKQYKPKQNINDLPPYCKVCHDAGKSDYNKHGLKDKNGKTICPYLLSLQCNTCKAFGHTQKHCDKKKQSAQTEDKFCGFCYKVNKNDPAYKTHYVRKIKDDPDSEITCPRLKTTRCNYCKELGHTVISCNKRKLHLAYEYKISAPVPGRSPSPAPAPAPVLASPSPTAVPPSPTAVPPSPVAVSPSPAAVSPSPTVASPSPSPVSPSPLASPSSSPSPNIAPVVANAPSG